MIKINNLQQQKEVNELIISQFSMAIFRIYKVFKISNSPLYQ